MFGSVKFIIWRPARLAASGMQADCAVVPAGTAVRWTESVLLCVFESSRASPARGVVGRGALRV